MTDQTPGNVHTFVLDLESNPHPRMLRGGLEARQRARDQVTTAAAAIWYGYLSAMCDATGCEPEEIGAWLDRHEAKT